MWPSDWPSSARAIATAVEAAVSAARAADEAGFGTTTADLSELPADQVTSVLAAIVRDLLEIAHPDGLTGDDVRAVLESVVRRSATWLPRLDAAAVFSALAGALGIDEAAEPDRAWTNPQPAAVLLIEYLADLARTPPGDAVQRAINEIARAETVEMP
ncbi:hypothetical protein ACFTS5_08420 [Nocardia sp. NPDC056952]|uniref:hypothetical protein n=1 Tax=Nocardia sp. NPDC056952 TaxID=3345979 RepID=UPI00362E1744